MSITTLQPVDHCMSVKSERYADVSCICD